MTTTQTSVLEKDEICAEQNLIGTNDLHGSWIATQVDQMTAQWLTTVSLKADDNRFFSVAPTNA
jgi:hypothetical protein